MQKQARPYLLRTYDIIGNRLTIKDFRTNAEYASSAYTQKFEYDYAGRVLKEYNIDGYSATIAYNNYTGKPLTQTDYMGNTTTYTYNKIGLLTQVVSPFAGNLKRKSMFYYDKAGNQTVAMQQDNKAGEAESYKTIKTAYNTDNQPVVTTQYDNNIPNFTKFEYDAVGRQTALYTGLSGNINTDTDFAKTEYIYDYLNRPTCVIDAMGVSVTTNYYGNIAETIDKNGITNTTEIDGLGRIKRQSAGDEERLYAYDMLGNILTLTTKENAVITDQISYTYDDMARLLTETTGSITKNYTYDSNSNRKTFILKDGNTQIMSLSYVYKKNNLLESVNDVIKNQIVATYGYNNNKVLTSTSYPNGTSTAYVYNNANMLTSLSNKKGNAVVEKFDYTYYLDGNQATKTALNNQITSYIYDGLGRLKSETLNGAATAYTYDDFSNRQTMSTANSLTNYLYNKNNQLIKEVAGNQTTNYFYDNNGNLYSKLLSTLEDSTTEEPKLTLSGLNEQDMLLEYNKFNQLTKVEKGADVISYTYNAGGLRASKTVNGATTGHIWDGQNMVAETGSGNIVTAKYLRGLRLVARQVGIDTEYYNFNGHGDTTSLTNASGNVIISYTFDAFGVQTNSNLNDTNPFRYCGEYADVETGMIYLRARYYDPALGRFISEDPIKDGLNWYVYCGSNPVNFRDPTGLSGTRFVNTDSDGGVDLKVRSGAGTSHSIVGTVANRGTVSFTGNKTTQIIDGHYWAEITYDGDKRWVAATFLRLAHPDAPVSEPVGTGNLADLPGYDDSNDGATIMYAEQIIATAAILTPIIKEVLFGSAVLSILKNPSPPSDYPKPPNWNENWEWRYPEGPSTKPSNPRWFDPSGGEWRYHAPDKYHDTPHWDYNPWDSWNSGWQNIYPN